MIKTYLYNLFLNKQILDLFFILIIYIINYLVLFKFGSKITRSKITIKQLIKTSVFVGVISLLTKPFLNENIFGIITSVLIVLVLTYYLNPDSLNSFWKFLLRSCWAFIIINLVIGICVGIICSPLLIIVPKEFYISTIGIIVGTIFEFGPILVLLIIFRDRNFNIFHVKRGKIGDDKK